MPEKKVKQMLRHNSNEIVQQIYIKWKRRRNQNLKNWMEFVVRQLPFETTHRISVHIWQTVDNIMAMHKLRQINIPTTEILFVRFPTNDDCIIRYLGRWKMNTNILSCTTFCIVCNAIALSVVYLALKHENVSWSNDKRIKFNFNQKFQTIFSRWYHYY